MQNASSALDDFFAKLNERKRGLLLLDYDGTLAPFVDDRLKAVPAPGIREAVDDILTNDATRVVFVSGRPCEELLALAELSRPVEVWGCHGREYRRLDGTIDYHGVTPYIQDALRREHAWLASHVPPEKAELKTGCLAFHWRGVPAADRDHLLSEVVPRWNELAKKASLHVLNFDGGIELAVPGRTKGDAIEQILSEHEGEDRVVAFLGDDLTDEDGFRALGRRGLSVLVRAEPRETAAQVLIPGPDTAVEFLKKWKAAIT